MNLNHFVIKLLFFGGKRACSMVLEIGEESYLVSGSNPGYVGFAESHPCPLKVFCVG